MAFGYFNFYSNKIFDGGEKLFVRMEKLSLVPFSYNRVCFCVRVRLCVCSIFILLNVAVISFSLEKNFFFSNLLCQEIMNGIQCIITF